MRHKLSIKREEQLFKHLEALLNDWRQRPSQDLQRRIEETIKALSNERAST